MIIGEFDDRGRPYVEFKTFALVKKVLTLCLKNNSTTTYIFRACR